MENSPFELNKSSLQFLQISIETEINSEYFNSVYKKLIFCIKFII